MTRAEWKTAYEIGHTRIDFEHRIFLDLIQEIESDLAREMPLKRIERRLIELYKYADFHFYSEESIMVLTGYPDHDRHRRIHQGLLEELRGYTMSVSFDLVRGKDLVGFLVQWFATHTTSEDLNLAAFIKGRG